MIIKYKSDFIYSYFGVISRYAFLVKTNWYEYIRKILENYWPWLPFLIIGIVNFIKYRHKEQFLKNPLFDINFLTILVYFVSIHIASYKAVQYLVPLYIPFALFSAYGIKIVDKNNILKKIFISIGVVLVVLWIFFPLLPETLDSKEFKELQKMFPDIKNINKEIISLNNGNFWHFSNGLLFYLNKEVTPVDFEDLLNLLNSKDRKIFLLKKTDYSLLPEDIIKRTKIIRETKESILFSN